MSCPKPYSYRATVVRWIDGDTLVADIDLGFQLTIRDVHLRLADIDTPEQGKPGFGQAKRFVESKCPVGAQVFIRTFVKDSFGRWIAELWFLDVAGRRMNLRDALVISGYATPYKE